MLKTTIIIIFCSFSSILFGQTPNLLFYIEGENHLFSMEIEKILNDLHYHNEPDKLILKRITSLNRIEDASKSFEKRRDIIDGIINKKLSIPKKWPTEQEEILESILLNDLFLKIRFKSTGTALEYNFDLFQPIRGETVDTFSYYSMHKLESSYCIIDNTVDGRKQRHTKLENAVKQLFSESNIQPIANIQINHYLEANNKNFTIGQGDSITLDASKSIDANSPRNSLSYEWTQINNTISSQLYFKENSSLQNLIFKDKGIYKIGLIVNDGITKSAQKTVVIKVIDKPKIVLNQKKIDLIAQGNAFTSNKSRNYKLYLKHQNITASDSLYVKLKNISTFRVDGIVNYPDSMDYRVFRSNKYYKTILRTNLKAGEYELKFRTQSIAHPLLQSNDETLILTNYIRNSLWSSAHLELHSFNYSEGTDTTFISMSGIALRIRAFIYKNIGFEVGFNDIFKINQGITKASYPYTFNHLGIMYKIPSSSNTTKPHIHATCALIYRYIPNIYNPTTMTLSNVGRLGFGTDLSFHISPKIPLHIDFGIQFFKNQYRLPDTNIVQGGYGVIIFGISYSGDFIRFGD